MASEETAARLSRRLEEAGRRASGAVFSDYGYGSVGKDSVEPLRRAMPASAPILVDSRHGLQHYRGADALTPNEEELEECAGQPLGDSAVLLDQAAAALRKETGCPMLLVTRGSQGMTLFRDGDPPVHISRSTAPTRSPTSPAPGTPCSRRFRSPSPPARRRSRRRCWRTSPAASSS